MGFQGLRIKREGIIGVVGEGVDFIIEGVQVGRTASGKVPRYRLRRSSS